MNDEIVTFRDDGYVVVRNLLSRQETDLLAHIARRDKHLAESAYGRRDASGQVTTLA